MFSLHLQEGRGVLFYEFMPNMTYQVTKNKLKKDNSDLSSIVSSIQLRSQLVVSNSRDTLEINS